MMRVGALLGAALLLAMAATYVSQRDAGPAAATGGVLAIAAGEGHTCVLLPDSGVQCWGRNDSGQLGDGTENPSTSPVDVCASGSGPGCSGGQRLTGVVDISAGFAHTCALLDSGDVMCWGINASGELGDGTTDARSTAGHVCTSGMGPDCTAGEPLSGAVQIDSGAGFNCALMEDTSIKCWGSDQVGQLGQGTLVPAGSPAGGFGGSETHPVSVCEPSLVVGVEAEAPAGIIILPPPCFVLTGFTAVTTGGEHACALLEGGGAQCWGSGFYGRLGTGTDATFTSPTDVCVPPPIILPPMAGIGTAGVSCTPISGLVAIDAGAQHTCAITDAGGVKCWGRDSDGQLGDGVKVDERLYPVNVCASGSGASCGGSPLTGVTYIAGGSNYHCAIAAAGDVRCWGGNFQGVLGDGTTDQHENPVPVSGLTGGVSVLQGGSRATHACAVAPDDSLRCWGNNHDGQLGISPDDDDHPLPVVVPGFTKPTPTATNTPVPAATNTPTATNTPPAGATPTNTPPPGGLIGDVDCSGGVNAIDAAYVLQYIAGLLPALPCPENADTNEDGTVNSIDVALILQYSAGLLGTLPP